MRVATCGFIADLTEVIQPRALGQCMFTQQAFPYPNIPYLRGSQKHKPSQENLECCALRTQSGWKSKAQLPLVTGWSFAQCCWELESAPLRTSAAHVDVIRNPAESWNPHHSALRGYATCCWELDSATRCAFALHPAAVQDDAGS